MRFENNDRDNLSNPDSLNSNLFGEAIWVAALRWGTLIVSWPATIILARLLSPQDYGYVALVAVFVRFGVLVAEGGFGNVVVLGELLPENAYRRLHGWSITFFIVSFVLLAVAAVPIEMLYESVGVRWIVIAVASGALIAGITVIPVARMRRELRLRELSIFHAVLAITESVTAVTCAILGFGYWSLVVGFVAGQVVFTGLVVRAFSIRPLFPSLEGLHKTLSDARKVLVAQVSNFFAESSGAWVGAIAAGTTALGGYSFMSGLANSPLEKISGILMYVGGSAIGSIRDDAERLTRALIRMIRITATVMFPIFAGIILVADDLIFALLGEKWIDYVPALQIYCVYAMFVPLLSIIGTGVIAAGGARDIAHSGLIRLFIMPPAFYILGSAYGATGLALAWILPIPFVFALLQRSLFNRLEMSITTTLAALMRPFFSIAIMSIVIVLIFGMKFTSGWSPLAILGSKVVLGGLVFLPLVVFLQRDDLRWLLASMESRYPGRGLVFKRLLRL